MFDPSSPVTGGSQTGFTSPTYTLTDDLAPNANGKQVAVTAVGGTQTGVTTHSVSSPFTITFTRPKTLKTLGMPNSNGYISSVPRNLYKLIVRKGVTPAADQPAQVMLAECYIHVPAGADTYDAANVRAALSAMIGTLTAESAGIGDSAVEGII
jgi:hypothetical protein